MRALTLYLSGACGTAILGLLLAGCSTAHHRKAADREVYGLIAGAERHVLGQTNDFGIDTPYSSRDPHTILPAEIIEDRTGTNSRTLSLEQALDLAVKNSREYQTQKEQLYLAALSLTSATHEFAPIFTHTTDAGFEGTVGGPHGVGANTRLSVSKLLKTGGSLSLTLANDLFRWYAGPGAPSNRNTARNIVSVNLLQPLLRGFGVNDPAVENLTQAERNLVYAIRDYSQFQDRFAVDIVNDYFQLLQIRSDLRNSYTNYLRRVETTRYTEARSVDRASPLDVEDARFQELQAQIGYINTVAQYLNRLDAFKITLGLPISEALYLDDTPLRVVDQAGPVPADISREAAFRLATERHSTLLNAVDEFEDSKRQIRLAADRFKPRLDLTGQANLASDAPTDLTKFDIDNLSYSGGFILQLPLETLPQRNAYRLTLIRFEQAIRSLGLALDSFKQRIDGSLRTLEQQRLNILSRQTALKSAERRLASSTILFQAGRREIRDVREAQDNLIGAQNDLTASIVSYLQARLQLLLDIGVIETESEGFWLKDPLAQFLQPEMRGRSPLEMPRDQLIPPNQFLEPAP
jgi:outer membrane protein TolC